MPYRGVMEVSDILDEVVLLGRLTETFAGLIIVFLLILAVFYAINNPIQAFSVAGFIGFLASVLSPTALSGITVFMIYSFAFVAALFALLLKWAWKLYEKIS